MTKRMVFGLRSCFSRFSFLSLSFLLTFCQLKPSRAYEYVDASAEVQVSIDVGVFALAAKKPSSLAYQVFYPLRDGAWRLEREGEIFVPRLEGEGNHLADPLTFAIAQLRPGRKKLVLQLWTGNGDSLERKEIDSLNLQPGANRLQVEPFALAPASLVGMQFETELHFEVEGSLTTLGFDRVEPLFAANGPGECAACHNFEDPFKDDSRGLHLASRPYFAWGKSDLVGQPEEAIVLRVIDTLKHLPGFDPMPPEEIAPAYSKEQIQLVEFWLQGGLVQETQVVSEFPAPRVERIELVLYDPGSSTALPTEHLNLASQEGGSRVVASAFLPDLEFGHTYQADLRVFGDSDRLILVRPLAIEVKASKWSHRLEIKLSPEEWVSLAP